MSRIHCEDYLSIALIKTVSYSQRRFLLFEVIRCTLQIYLGRSGYNCNSSPSITTNKSKNTFANEQKNLKEKEMKTLRRFCAAFVLALALSLAAFAGTMPAGVTAPPPPPPDSEVTAQGEMPTGITGNMSTGVTATDPMTEGLLNLLQSLLSLF
jgi:hypothetical protein